MLDSMQRKKQRDSCPTRAAKCMLKRLCKYYSEAPVLSWSFPYQEMPSEIRAVTDANWAGVTGGTALDVVWMDLLW